jgi:hypothetical protein
MRINQGGTPYPTSPTVVGGNLTPVSIWVIEDDYNAPANTTTKVGVPFTDGSVATDEGGKPAPTNDSLHTGMAVVSFTNWGDHAIRATGAGRVPARGNVCTSDGQDGFCGTVKPDFNPFVEPPSPCATNGHDGLCGTIDTLGPATHVTNITDKKVFKTKKGPGQVKGTIDTDPNGVGGVRLRLTRVTTSKVLIKAKKSKSNKKAKKRYKTVKRCTTWNDATALLATAKCGTKYGKWFKADLNDLRNEFSYSFAMTLPKGTYTLEVSATDEDGHLDPPTSGRNVLTFAVN